MVPFAGYALPVQYPDGVLKSHLHARAPESSALFDVGHMGQIKWHGKDAAKFLETLVVADVQGLAEGSASLTLLTTDEGGIIDDSIVTNHGKYM
jgi:aminomethyltransferase